MKRRDQKKANRISWASGANLCQVRYFQRADRPCKVGRQTRDHPQLDASSSYSGVGISGGSSANVPSKIPQVQWKTPPKFALRSNWLVASGEESEEVEVQKHREARVLEAVYPRISAIPPRPLISLEVEGEFYDDNHTPIVPIIPIEETAKMDLSTSKPAAPNTSVDSPPGKLLQGPSTSAKLNIPPCRSVSNPEPSNKGKSALPVSHSLEGNPVNAAAAAGNANLKSKASGSLIDTDLLVKLLEDPEMTQKLINEHMLSAITETETSESKVVVPSVPLPSSQLLIDKSDNENSKHADSGTEAIRRPLTIKLSSFCHAKTGTASGPEPIQPSLSLLRSTNEMIKSSSHENNQPPSSGNIAATQTAEQLLTANRTGTGSRPKHETPSVSQTSSSCDVPSKKSTRSQPLSIIGQTVTKPVKRSLAANPESGTCSQPKQEASSVTLLSSAPNLQSKKPTNEHGQLGNFGSAAMLKPVIDEIGSGSAVKTGSLSVPLPVSSSDLPDRKSTNEHNQQASTGNVVVIKPVVTQSVASDTDFGMGFGVQRGTPPVSLPSLVHDLPCKKPTSEHDQKVDAGNVMVPKPVVTQSLVVSTANGTGFRTKTGTPPISLPILVHDLQCKRSSSEHYQQVNTGNGVVPKPLVTQSVAANTGSKTGFSIKTGSPPLSVPMSVHGLPASKFTNEHNQHLDTGNMVVHKPVMTQSVAPNTGMGTGSRIKTVMPQVFLPTLHPGMLDNKSSKEQYQPPRKENAAVLMPLMQSLAANSTNGTGCRPTAVTPSASFPITIPDFCSKKPASRPCQQAVAGTVIENQPPPVPRIKTMMNVVTGTVAENQPISIPRINAELLGTPPNFGSAPVTNQVHLTGPNCDISRLKKLIDEHGAHVMGGNGSGTGITPVFPNPSRPHLENLKKMISEFGSHNNLEIPLSGSEPLIVPSPVTTFGALAPSREHRQLPQRLPAAFSASPYSALVAPQLTDMLYNQALLIQHKGDHALLQQNKPQNYLQASEARQNAQVVEFEPKFQKPCLFFNTPNGCRNGSRCRFQHDLSKQWRSGGILEAPSGKRMKQGGEITGRT